MELREKLETLRASSSTLNLARDQMNSGIDAFESALNALNLGVAGWVTHPHPHRHPVGDNGHYLGYSKIVGKKWHLLIELRKRDKTSKSGFVPVAEWERWRVRDAPSHLRVELVKLLPDLLDHLLTQSQNMLKAVRNANEFVGQCLLGVELAQQEIQKEQEAQKEKGSEPA